MSRLAALTDGLPQCRLDLGTIAKVGNQQSLPVVAPEIPNISMSRRWYIETTPSGKQQFVSIKHSRSNGHHHHRHEHDTCKVSREEWKRLVERERCLDETNKSLVCEVSALKASLSTAQAEAHHLCHIVVPQLQGQINVLCADNDALRRSIDNAGQNSSRYCREEERLKEMIDKLEKEKNDIKKEATDLREKVKCLARQVEQGCGRRLSELLRDMAYWKDQCRYWKLKFEDSRQRHDDTCGMLEIRTEKMRAYEEILKRRRII